MQDSIRLKVYPSFEDLADSRGWYVAGENILTRHKAFAARFNLEDGQRIRNAYLKVGWAVEQDTVLGIKVLG